jgi:membrane-bound ClpP family serine protease
VRHFAAMAPGKIVGASHIRVPCGPADRQRRGLIMVVTKTASDDYCYLCDFAKSQCIHG